MLKIWGRVNSVNVKKALWAAEELGLKYERVDAGLHFGVMGGTMQPQGHAQVVIRIADYGQSPQAACDGPRFRVVQGLDVSMEEGRHAPSTLEELQRRGHRIVNVDDYNQFGSAQLIWKLDGGYFTASDPRRDGQAVGF